MYVIFVGLSLQPDTPTEENDGEMKASLQIMMGNVLSDFFEYNAMLIMTGLDEKPESEIE